jgi:hypothetical protein
MKKDETGQERGALLPGDIATDSRFDVRSNSPDDTFQIELMFSGLGVRPFVGSVGQPDAANSSLFRCFIQSKPCRETETW